MLPSVLTLTDPAPPPAAAPASLPPDAAGGRVAALNLFRAVVCLQIVAMHTYFGPVYGKLSACLGPEADWLVSHLRFGYESFFVLAGYFLAHSFRPGRWSQFSVPKFLKRRVIRLAVPYWIAAALGVAGLLARERLTGAASGVPSWSEVLPVFLFAHTLTDGWSPSTALWFMAVLIQLYVAWCLTFWLVRRWYLWSGREDFHGRAVAALQALTAAAFVLSLWGYARGHVRPGTLAGSAVFVALGCVTYWQAAQPRLRVLLLAGVAALTVAGLAAESSRLVAAAVTGVILPLLAGRTVPATAPARAVAAVGVMSYSIYLTHMYVAPRVLHLWSARGGAGSFPEVAGVYLLSIAAAVAFGYVFYRLVERPLAHASRGVTYRVPAHHPEPAYAGGGRDTR